MGVLPDNYEVPTAEGGYMRFEEGENKFRVLSEPILGNEYWTDTDGGRKPNRFRMSEPIDVSKVPDPAQIKHFWAMVVWNYKANRLQVLEITQKTIQQAIAAYDRNPDWGDFRDYDLTVVRKGEGLNTEYQVMASPQKQISDEIKEAYKSAKINVEALFDNADPFSNDSADIAEITDEDLEEISEF